MVAGRSRRLGVLSHVLLIVLATLTLAPFALMVIRSFKTFAQAMLTGLAPSLPLHYGGYIRAWEAIHTYALNSIFVSSLSMPARFARFFGTLGLLVAQWCVLILLVFLWCILGPGNLLEGTQ